MKDKYFELAKEIAQNKIKTEEGLYALRCDLREAYNHMIELAEEYIEFNIEQRNYDKDPNCLNRLSINELEAIVKTADFDEYYADKLFSYNKHFNCFDEEELNKVINELFEKEIILK